MASNSGGPHRPAFGGKGVRGGKGIRDKKPYERENRQQDEQVISEYRYGETYDIRLLSSRITNLKSDIIQHGLSSYFSKDKVDGVIRQSYQNFQICPLSNTYREGRQYSNERKLGEGTYGSVSLIKDARSGAKCARKMMDITGYEFREVEILLAMGDHTLYIPHLIGLGLHGSQVHVFMQFVESTWFQYVAEAAELAHAQQKPFITPLEDLKIWLHDALRGLSYLHSREIQHRDIKPQNLGLGKLNDNVMVTKLIDFGAAITSMDREGLPLAGTIYYLAPKAAKCIRCLKDDVWSLGCSVIFMLTRDHPWTKHHNAFRATMNDQQSDYALIQHIANGGTEIMEYIKKAYDRAMLLWRDQVEATNLVALLCFMLCSDDEPRKTADQLLQEPFLCGLKDRHESLNMLLKRRQPTAQAAPMLPMVLPNGLTGPMMLSRQVLAPVTDSGYKTDAEQHDKTDTEQSDPN